MISKTTHAFWLLAFLAIVCGRKEGHALGSHGPFPNYVRHQWTADSSFPGGSVGTIAQTPDGYLWLGTQKGLLRFDGLEFRLNSSPQPLFQNDRISNLMTGPDSKLWVFFWGAGILREDNGRLQGVAPSVSQSAIQVTAAWRNENGSILLADSINGIIRVQGERTERLAPADALPGSALVVTMAESGDGSIWLGTSSQGLFLLKDGHVQPVAPGILTRRINCLLPAGGKALWVGADSGLFRWDGMQLTRVSLPKEAKDAQILTMLRDRQSTFWVGTTRGLVRMDDRGVFFSDENSFAIGGITSLFEDREANLWVGGARGLERLSENTFVTYNRTDRLPAEVNGPVHVDDAGQTWVAPQQGGVDLISEGSVRHLRSDFLDHNVIYSIAGHRNEIWMGTQNGGLAHVILRNGMVETSRYTHADGLAENSVYSVALGRDGSVWAGTLTAGASLLKGGRFVTYTRTDGLASDTVFAIVETYDGTVWFATPNGLSALTGGQWTTLTRQDGLASNGVNCLFEDRSGSLWVGTSAGLTLVEHGHVRALTDLPASLHDQVFGLAQDLSGRLWIETANHILRVQPMRLRNGELKSLDVREYDMADGLPNIEGVRRSNSVVAGKGGQIWFSLRNAVTMVDSARVSENSVPAMAHVDRVLADNVSVPIGDSVRIPPFPQRITFGYTGVSLAVPERVRFRYFLQGFDHTWSEPVTNREAVYTNLGPGQYRFRLVASNSDGLWNGVETSLAFRVEPAFWQTVWFRIAVVLIVLQAFWMAYRFRTHQLTRQLNVRFLDRLEERNRIAQELHDTLLQSLQGVILRFQSINEMLPAHPDEAKQSLEGSLKRADKALVEGRDAIMDIRSTTAADFDLSEVMRSMIAEMSEEAGLASNRDTSDAVSIQGTRRNVQPRVRDDICRIVREALRNAVQHAMTQHIHAEIIYGEAALQLRVLDKGKGMDPRVGEQGARTGHWGLIGMRERAKRIGATLEIHSKLGEGTDVRLTLPAKLAYESHGPRRQWWSLFSG